MSLIDILIILGCLAGGYWIVSSVMAPGVDITRRDQQPRESAPKSLPSAREADWHLLLDIPRSASRSEIEAAYKRQLNKALANGDTHQQERLRLAREAALSPRQ
jgi:hypothetical protein